MHRDRDGEPEVLLVHRPRYDDWSLPKGKRDPSEHILRAARREIEEETGLRVRLGPPLAVQRYAVGGDRAPKVVHYWAAEPVGQTPFEPNDEVDALRWLPLREARRLLSYPRDAEVLDAFDAVGTATATVVLLRHATAVKRQEWDGKDTARPLDDAGAGCADRLADVLQALGADRVLSSDAERCLATVAPYAASAGLAIEELREISEAGYDADAAGLPGLAGRIWSPGQVTVVCSHRPVLPALARALGLNAGRLAPGAFLVAHRLTGERLLTERFGAP